MALQISKTSPFGTEATYHRIGQIKTLMTHSTGESNDPVIDTTIYIEGYSTKAVRNIVPKPPTIRAVEVKCDQTFNNFAQAYTYLKTLPDWDNSSDI